MVEFVIYIIGLLIWVWLVPKHMPKDPSMSDKGMFEVKLMTIIGIFWPLLLIMMLITGIFAGLSILLDKYIAFRTKEK